MKIALNIAYTQSHHKGGDNIGTLNGTEHAEWLEQAVLFYHRRLGSFEFSGHMAGLFVSITGWPGWPDVSAGRERDALWRAFWRARFITMTGNPGHQVGAAWCVRLGLEAAGKLGYDCMIHAAEDVIPGPGVLKDMVYWLAGNDGPAYDYAGEAWGPNRDELNTQFFACRVPYLAGVFDPTKIPEHSHIERYMAWILRDRTVCRQRFAYNHTHAYGDWQRWVKGST